jgi:hypothetical protein
MYKFVTKETAAQKISTISMFVIDKVVLSVFRDLSLADT